MNIVKNTVSLSYSKGIIADCLVFDIPKILANAGNMLYYRFNIDDVIEVEFKNENNMIITDFATSKVNIEKNIRDSSEFYAGYFKSAGLLGKKFLFNTELRVPVIYSDFIETKQPFLNKNTMSFIYTDTVQEGYIVAPSTVYVYSHPATVRIINKMVMSVYLNASKQVIKPSSSKTYISGYLLTGIISGLFSGMDIKEIEALSESSSREDVNALDWKIDKLSMDKSKILDELKTFKIDKIISIMNKKLEVVEEEFYGKAVNLTRLISLGLSGFVKSLGNIKERIDVNIDFQVPVKKMYINNGALFVVPQNNMIIEELKELLASDDIYPVREN